MKDSGLKWVGEIPTDWKKVKLKYIAHNFYSGGTPTASNESFYCTSKDSPNFINISDISNNDHVYNSKKKLTIKGVENKNLKIVNKRALLYGMYASVGVVSEVKVPSYISQAILSFEISNEWLRRFVKLYLVLLQNSIGYFSSGTTQFNVNADIVKNFDITIPDIESCKKIVLHVEGKLKSINDLIILSNKSISDLKKYKQSIITEAVTKGLNPDAEMKDSGIEWIGSVPIHWMLSKISKVTSSYSGGTPSRNVNNYWENGSIPWVSSGEVSKKLIYESNEYITDLGLRNSSAKMMPKNTVIVALNGQGKTKGSSAILKISASTNQSLVGFICNKELLDYRFLNYVFNASYSYNRSYYAGGNKREGIAASDLRGKRIPLPPLEEQIIIVNHLEEINNNIDKLILDKTNLIEELENYKKSVIYEYVTGKKEA